MALLLCTLTLVAVSFGVSASLRDVLPPPPQCGASLKVSSNGSSCEPLDNRDVLRAIAKLADPPRTTCKNVTKVQDISVCEDEINLGSCVVWSVVVSNMCDLYGSLAFEKYWSERGCQVKLFHLHAHFKSNVCSEPEGPLKGYPNIEIIRSKIWVGDCYACFYTKALAYLPATPRIDVLKVQSREGVSEDMDGVQFPILADLFLYAGEISSKAQQVVLTVSLNSRTLSDHVGRDSSNAWNMWATQQLLRNHAAFAVAPQAGPGRLLPLQFAHLLGQARLSDSTGLYRNSFRRVTGETLSLQQAAHEAWVPAPPKHELHGKVPAYCTPPSALADATMQNWIRGEMNTRCHPTRLHVACERHRGYDSILPCPQELMDHLAEDYAATKGWCDFDRPEARIPHLNVDAAASRAFQKPPRVETGAGADMQVPPVRLAFFFTVYSDAAFVARLFYRLQSPNHYYLFHLDNSVAGVSAEFERDMRALVANHSNAFLCKDVPIVYGASSATILLTKAMAWFDRFATGWDYFVPLTGSDYPLVPLPRIERIFASQRPPMPFVMAWTPGTSTHIFRLGKTFPIFEKDPLIAKSIKAVTDERGRVLGAVPMEFRSNNFGPPLFCANRSSFVHLDNRYNKSGRVFDTQWLFPRDVFRNRGRAFAEERPEFSTPSFDGVWRVWKKSDPATTGAYDRASVSYIVDSSEGRKYWHFFKHMLLGSEEHYYVSLLYNWQRTKAFVQTLSAEIVWNTWEAGLWERSDGFQTHTHFLSMEEWDIIKGFSKRGMIFARKFSTLKTAALLDRIDQTFLLNATSDAGLYWPGFFKVDTTTPGKEWVASFRRISRLKREAEVKAKRDAGSFQKGLRGVAVGSKDIAPVPDM